MVDATIAASGIHIASGIGAARGVGAAVPPGVGLTLGSPGLVFPYIILNSSIPEVIGTPLLSRPPAVCPAPSLFATPGPIFGVTSPPPGGGTPPPPTILNGNAAATGVSIQEFVGNLVFSIGLGSQEVSGAGHNSTSSPLSWSFANNSGNLLIVGIVASSNGNAAPTVSSVTYGGATMTAVPSGNFTISGQNPTFGSLYYLPSPVTGSNTVSVGFTGNGTYVDCIGGAISFNNAPTSSVVGTGSSTTGVGGTTTLTLAGTGANHFVVSITCNGSGVNSANSPTNLSWVKNVTAGTTGDNAGFGQQATGGGGNITASFVGVGGESWGIAMVEVM